MFTIFIVKNEQLSEYFGNGGAVFSTTKQQAN